MCIYMGGVGRRVTRIPGLQNGIQKFEIQNFQIQNFEIRILRFQKIGFQEKLRPTSVMDMSI